MKKRMERRDKAIQGILQETLKALDHSEGSINLKERINGMLLPGDGSSRASLEVVSTLAIQQETIVNLEHENAVRLSYVGIASTYIRLGTSQ
mmetsp:Transcript_44283/g.115062  ORF Transcript_44283/g.115062 Transcript_44283/m.115062 type:complete len:92 (-) Transcript_44283:1103-1378(-)